MLLLPQSVLLLPQPVLLLPKSLLLLPQPKCLLTFVEFAKDFVALVVISAVVPVVAFEVYEYLQGLCRTVSL